VLRIGTLALAGIACLDFSLGIATTGSYVPHQSLRWCHATFMPDARQPVNRLRLSLSRAIHISRFRRHRSGPGN
jgi:hypothetical protein